MASLHPPLAVAAAPHSDIETAHYGAPDNLFLLLCFAAFRFHAAAAMRAVLWQWNRDSFIYARWDGAARLPAVVAARFAAWPLWIGFWGAARMRRGLALAGAQRGLQFLAETLDFLLEPLNLVSLLLNSLLGPVQLSLGNKIDAFRLLVPRGLARWSHPTLR